MKHFHKDRLMVAFIVKLYESDTMCEIMYHSLQLIVKK
jgi:hypothetical protein